MAVATFGAGCFWGIEETYRTTAGVTDTKVGYMGGTNSNPTYREVCTGTTGHAEVVQVLYNPEIIDYNALLDIFFANHNPTELNRQGPDVGTQYRSVIFVHSDDQIAEAQQRKASLIESGQYKRDIVTEIVPVMAFWEAEDYHQQYLAKRGASSCHF